MSSYKNFQSDNQKHINKNGRTNIYNPDFTPAVSSKSLKDNNNFLNNIHKWKDFFAWMIFYPDLFLDLISPPTGGIKLDLDQRLFLRVMTRFAGIYGVFPRGWSKTYLEILGMYIIAIAHPNIKMSITAQTKENAANLLRDKHGEIVTHFPLLENEVFKTNFSKDGASVEFTSGAVINILANAQSSKGNRRHRINVEESALLDDFLFQDVLRPIPSEARRTIGKLAIVNPEELNGTINFFTTSGYRGSSEYSRNIIMFKEMCELKGKFVFGADWRLANHFGRGMPKSEILSIRDNSSPIAFDQNYLSKWTGCSDGALVDMNKMISLRILDTPKFKKEKSNEEFFISVDVARSLNNKNCMTIVTVLQVKRNKNNKITQVLLVNIIGISNTLHFSIQASEIKKIKRLYDARICVVDCNGVGGGLKDYLMDESFDENGDSLGCWDSVNTDDIPKVKATDKCLFIMLQQGMINTDVINSFVDMINSGKLKILEKKQNSDYNLKDKENYIENIIPFIQTDELIEEVSNLQLKQLPLGKLTVEPIVKKIGKDRYAALAYGLYYIKTFEDNIYIEENESIDDYFQMF